MIGRMLIGLQLSFWFLEPTLKTGVILVNLKEAEKIEEQIASLNWQHISVKNSAFSFKIFMGMSESCTALLISKFLISFLTVFYRLGENRNLINVGGTPNGVNIRVILILQNSCQVWVLGKPIVKCIYMMLWNIKIFDNV